MPKILFFLPVILLPHKLATIITGDGIDLVIGDNGAVHLENARLTLVSSLTPELGADDDLILGSDEDALVFASVGVVRERFKGNERWAAAVLKEGAGEDSVGR